MAVVGVVAQKVLGLLPELAGDSHQMVGLIVDDSNRRLHQLAVLGGVVQILPVGIDLVHNGLGLRVKAGVDAQAAPLEGHVCLLG